MSRPSRVYFMRINSDGPVKIGFTAQSVTARLCVLQVGCPWPISLIGSVAGTVFHEKWLHRKFDALRMIGEWFQPKADLIATISEILAAGFVWPVVPTEPENLNPLVLDLLAEIDRFLSRSGMSATAFGRVALNDPNFVHDVRSGRMPNLGLVGRVQKFIRFQEACAA